MGSRHAIVPHPRVAARGRGAEAADDAGRGVQRTQGGDEERGGEGNERPVVGAGRGDGAAQAFGVLEGGEEDVDGGEREEALGDAEG
jgi:hypothetical protein